MRLIYTGLILLIFISSASYAGNAPIDVNDYIKLKNKIITKIPYETLRTEPSAFVGKIFEIRGKVTGFVGMGGTCHVCISHPQGQSWTIKLESIPEVDTGTDVACLVKISEGSLHSLSDLKLIACTYEIELKRIEERTVAQAKKATQTFSEKPKTATAKQKTLLTNRELVSIYKNAIRGFNKKLTEAQAETIATSILGFSYKYKVDPRLVCAVILSESHFRIDATSGAGAQGLGQLMPSTAAGLGVNNSYDPVDNVYGSVRYIRSMLDRVTGKGDWNDLTWYDLGNAIAAYNAGPGAVKRHGGIPPYRETQRYVVKVTNTYKTLCGIK